MRSYYRKSDGQEVEADEATDDGQLLDGYTMKTRFQLMDSLNITPHMLLDALNERRVFNDEAKDAALDRHEAWLNNAWKHPTPVIDTEEARKRGLPPPPRIKDGTTPYERYDKRITDAWRSA